MTLDTTCARCSEPRFRDSRYCKAHHREVLAEMGVVLPPPVPEPER